MALMALKLAATAAQAAAEAKQVYEQFKEQAQRTRAFTPEESAELDAEEARIKASAAQQKSGR